MTERNYTSFAQDCPDRLLVLFRGNSGKIIDSCGQIMPELVSECDDHDGWKAPGDGLYIVDVSIEDSKTWTDYGWEYDTNWEPTEFTPVTDEMWKRFLADEHLWPVEYYSMEED